MFGTFEQFQNHQLQEQVKISQKRPNLKIDFIIQRSLFTYVVTLFIYEICTKHKKSKKHIWNSAIKIQKIHYSLIEKVGVKNRTHNSAWLNHSEITLLFIWWTQSRTSCQTRFTFRPTTLKIQTIFKKMYTVSLLSITFLRFYRSVRTLLENLIIFFLVYTYNKKFLTFNSALINRIWSDNIHFHVQKKKNLVSHTKILSWM